MAINQNPVTGAPDAYCDPRLHRKLIKKMRGDKGFTRDSLHAVGVRIGAALGGSFFYPSEDRTILECVILPYYQLSKEHQSILFVGSDWYTHGYSRMFARKSYRTIDPDPAHARYGSQNHIVDILGHIERYVEPDSLDLIVVNGVVGWGLNAPEAADETFAACHRVLRPGGHLLIGWNDVPAYRPFTLSTIQSLKKFRPLEFEPLGRSQYLVDNEWRHTFSFYRK